VAGTCEVALFTVMGMVSFWEGSRNYFSIVVWRKRGFRFPQFIEKITSLNCDSDTPQIPDPFDRVAALAYNVAGYLLP